MIQHAAHKPRFQDGLNLSPGRGLSCSLCALRVSHCHTLCARLFLQIPVGDVKFKDPLSSNPEDIKRRGCFIGFGCTEPGTRAAMYGLEQRGEKGDGDFRPSDGGGYVAPKKADYSHLLSRGDSDLQMLLFETFGGWSVPVVRLFNKMRDKVRDKLSKKQYDDEVSWTTRTWSSLMAQRMSVALHMAAAWEVARELSLAGAEDEAALFGGGVADSVA